MSATLLPGIAITVLAGLIMGTSPWPLKLMRRFQYEHFAFVSMLVALVILPWAITLAFCPKRGCAARSGRRRSVEGQSVRVLLGNRPDPGHALLRADRRQSDVWYSLFDRAAVGVIVPMIVKASGVFQQAPDLLSTPGMIVMLGTLIMLLGVVLASLAGAGREKWQNSAAKSLPGPGAPVRWFHRRTGDGGTGRSALGRLGIRLHV